MDFIAVYKDMLPKLNYDNLMEQYNMFRYSSDDDLERSIIFKMIKDELKEREGRLAKMN